MLFTHIYFITCVRITSHDDQDRTDNFVDCDGRQTLLYLIYSFLIICSILNSCLFDSSWILPPQYVVFYLQAQTHTHFKTFVFHSKHSLTGITRDYFYPSLLKRQNQLVEFQGCNYFIPIYKYYLESIKLIKVLETCLMKIVLLIL